VPEKDLELADVRSTDQSHRISRHSPPRPS